ncbi:hypothetical protein [Acinetobacter sp.]|uniref:hypothetical protein n=1 Tax=Acinetobacter sp. TaxID=472 RepID=UPI003CFEDBF4
MAKEFQTVIKVGMNTAGVDLGSKEINSKLKALDSSFKAVNEQGKAFGETVTTLTKKKDILTEKIRLQSAKVAQLKEQYEKSKKETGENSQATEKLATRYNNAVAQLSKMQGELKKTTDALEKKRVKFNDVAKAATDFGEKAAKAIAVVTGVVVGATAAALKLADSMGRVADRLLDLSDITGMSTDEIQRWQYAAVIAGTDIEAVTAASEKFTRSLHSMDSESHKAREAARQLGISFNRLKNLDADARMDILIERLAQVEDKTERARLGADLFGGTWKDLAPIVGLGVEALREAKNNADIFTGEELQQANEFRIAFDKLKYTLSKLALTVGGELAPYLKEMIEKIQAAMPDIKEKVINSVKAILPFLELLARILTIVIQNLDIIIPAVLTLASAFAALKIVTFATNIINTFKAMNPVMLKTTLIIIGVVAALTALAAIIAVIMGRSREISTTFGDIGRSVSGMTSNLQSNIPRYATGTSYHPGGLALIGEQGPELVNLPQGSRVFPFRETREIIDRGGGDTFIFHVHMDEIDDLIKYAKAQKDMRRSTRMGLVTG